MKGTTSDGLEILLTPGEVRHSREQHPNVALFIVKNVRVAKGDGKPRVSGGAERLIVPWRADEANLKPVGYACAVPEEKKVP